jgi:PEP-CTERM/exosortase A-associated glycosyltransferase
VQAVTAICEGIKNDIVQRGFDASRITLIPNAVDVERFQPVGAPKPELQASLGLAGHYVLGFAGSFYAYEGLDLAIHAMPAVLQSVPNARLLLVGGGPTEPVLRQLVAELQLDGKVIFTGRVPNAVVQDYYALIDVLVFPRKRMRLTELVTPLKPLETMAQAMPLVASDVGGHRELIRHRETGLLFPADDAQALARQVIELHGDPALQQKLRERGRAFVSAERTWQRSVDNYEHVYRQAMAALPVAAKAA